MHTTGLLPDAAAGRTKQRAAAAGSGQKLPAGGFLFRALLPAEYSPGAFILPSDTAGLRVNGMKDS